MQVTYIGNFSCVEWFVCVHCCLFVFLLILLEITKDKWNTDIEMQLVFFIHFSPSGLNKPFSMSCKMWCFRDLNGFGRFYHRNTVKFKEENRKLLKIYHFGYPTSARIYFLKWIGFCWITLVPGGVLIKPLSCCWESKLYNQRIENSLSFGGAGVCVCEGAREEVMLWCAGSFPPSPA